MCVLAGTAGGGAELKAFLVIDVAEACCWGCGMLYRDSNVSCVGAATKPRGVRTGGSS